MSLSSTVNRINYSGNGSTTVFSYSYYFLDASDLVVLLVNDSTGVSVTQTITTDYTVSGAGNEAGGTVTMNTAPATGETLVIYRDPDLTQGVDLRENDSLPAETVEEALDRQMMVSQRTRELTERAVRLPDSFTDSFDLELPTDLNTAGNYIRVNAAGNAFEMDEGTASNIDNDDISATAAIEFSKMENLTANRALVSDASGDVSVSAVTDTEVGYLDGVTSAIQTQLDAKLDDFSGSTDNVIVRTDGTGGDAVQESGISIDDSDNMTTPGNIVLESEKYVEFQDNTGGEYVRLKAPATVSSSQTYSLPSSDGTSGQGLVTNGSGVLSWATAGNNLTVSSQSSDFNAVANRFYVVDTSSADVTATLPAAASNSGEVIILIVDDDTNTLIIDDIGGDNLELDNLNEYAVVRSDGTNWRILGTNKAPTVQKFTSGSGTYTTPAHVQYIVVEAVGGGGGGQGSGTAGGSAGAAGGNTTFGTSLIQANGGGGGTTLGVAGGTASLGSLIGVAIQGSGGSGRSDVASQNISSNPGGSSFFGGAGQGVVTGLNGGAGVANSGSGGGGAGLGPVSGANGGSGGSGGYVKAFIPTPNSSYSYAVGTGGSGGAAGTSGNAGGAGGSGVIIVTEYY